MTTPHSASPVPPAAEAPDRSRDYDAVVERLEASALGGATLDIRMQTVVDALWEAFSAEGYSWVGFYIADESAPESERLVLAARRDKPACSPIGLHGVCGRGYATRATVIVRDVFDLGEAYVACDPRDRSEIVLPIFEDGNCIGVLDVDSWEIGSFTERDEAGLLRVLRAAGFGTA
ncbi:MAG: GAF domain-containing protein [Phycisphaerales bacterium]